MDFVHLLSGALFLSDVIDHPNTGVMNLLSSAILRPTYFSAAANARSNAAFAVSVLENTPHNVVFVSLKSFDVP